MSKKDWFEPFYDLMGTSTHKEDIEELFRGDNRILAVQLIKLTQDFKQYWPMTLRAFYYQAVSALLVPNDIKQYRRVGKIMASLRRNYLISWRCMEDKTRSTSDKRGMPDVSNYIQNDLETFLQPDYYQRCYIQEQPVFIELSVEKDALSNHVRDAAWMHCTRVSVTRGQVSATMLNDMAGRFEKAMMRGMEPILLHFGDLDPTGIQIPKSMKEGLWKHHSLDIDVRQIALTPGQCDEHNLPQSLDAAKEGDPNIDRWYQEYGDQSPTELDALHPEDLKQLVVNSLDDIYDINEMDEQRQKEQEERDLLKEMRSKTFDFLEDKFPEYMKDIFY